MTRTWFVGLLLVSTIAYGQGQGGARGGPQGIPAAGAGRGGAAPAGVSPKPAIANVASNVVELYEPFRLALCRLKINAG